MNSLSLQVFASLIGRAKGTAANSALSFRDNRAEDFLKYRCDAASMPYTPSPNSATFR